MTAESAFFSYSTVKYSMERLSTKSLHQKGALYISECRFGYLISTPTKFYIYEMDRLNEFDYKFMVAEYCSEIDTIFAFASGIPRILALKYSGGLSVVSDEYNTEIISVDQIFYYDRKIVVCGVGFEIFDVEVTKSQFDPTPRVKLTRKCYHKVDHYGVANSRFSFDPDNKRFIMPLATGYSVFDFDGNLIHSESRLTHTRFKCSAVCYMGCYQPMGYFRKFACVDCEGKLKIIQKTDTKEYFVGDLPYNFLHFFDKEYLVMVTSDGCVFILNVKTGKQAKVGELHGNIECIRALSNWKMICSISWNIELYRFSVPWNLYLKLNRTVLQTCFADYLYAHSSDGFLNVYSLTTKELMSTFGTKTNKDKDSIYFYTSKNETYALIMYYNKKIVRFKLNGNECEFVDTLKTSSSNIHFGKYYLYTISALGELCLLDKTTYAMKKRLIVDRGEVLGVYEYEDSVYVFYNKLILHISIINYSIDRHKFKDCSYVCFGGSYFGVADPTCSFTVYEFPSLEERIIVQCLNMPTLSSIHNDLIICASPEGEIKLGGMDGLFADIEIPFPIYHVTVLNRNLDLIIALDKELMIIERDRILPWWRNPRKSSMIEYTREEEDGGSLNENDTKRENKQSQGDSEKEKKVKPQKPMIFDVEIEVPRVKLDKDLIEMKKSRKLIRRILFQNKDFISRPVTGPGEPLSFYPSNLKDFKVLHQEQTDDNAKEINIGSVVAGNNSIINSILENSAPRGVSLRYPSKNMSFRVKIPEGVETPRIRKRIVRRKNPTEMTKEDIERASWTSYTSSEVFHQEIPQALTVRTDFLDIKRRPDPRDIIKPKKRKVLLID